MRYRIIKFLFKVKYGLLESIQPIREESHITEDNRWYNDTIDYQILKLLIN